MGKFRYESDLNKAGITLPSKISIDRLELIQIGLELQDLDNEDVMMIINATSYFEAERVLIRCRHRGGRHSLTVSHLKKERELCYE